MRVVNLLILIIITIGCTSKSSKAKQLIKERLKMELNDFKSYDPIEFSDLDSAFLKVENSD